MLDAALVDVGVASCAVDSGTYLVWCASAFESFINAAFPFVIEDSIRVMALLLPVGEQISD